MSAPVDEASEAPPQPPAATAGGDRLEALEQQVRQLTSRMAGWVEAQLVQALDDRRKDMLALRSELQTVVNEQLAVVGEQLRAELRTFGDEQAKALAAVRAEVGDGPARVEGFEQRVKAAMVRLTEAVEARLAETAGTRDAALESVRAELARRLDILGREADVATAVVGAVQLSVAESAERTATLDRQVQSAVGRLGDSFEVRLVQLSAAHAGDVSTLRHEWTATATTLGARLGEVALRAGVVSDDLVALRVEAGAAATRAGELEQRIKAAVSRLAESVEGRLSELVRAQAAEVEAAGAALRGALATQAAELRAELDTATSAMRSRFVHAHERLDAVERQQREGSDRANEGVEARLAEVVERRRAEFDELRRELGDSVASQLLAGRTDIGTVASGHVRSALDAHLAETREEVTLALGQSRTDLAAGAAQLEALVVSVERTVQEAEAMASHLAGADAARADAADAAVASLGRKVAKAQVHTEQKLAGVVEQVGVLVKAAANEAGALAPLRSDVGQLQAQLAELAELVAELRPRRKAPARKAAPAKKAAPARKAAAPVKKVPATRRRVSS